MNVYKPRPYRIVMNTIYGIAASVIAYFIANIWQSVFVSGLIAVGIMILYVWLVILSNMITLYVEDGVLTVQKGSKRKSYDLANYTLSARMVTSNSDTECQLKLTDENGDITHIDCELIGIKQFEKLIVDLGICGEDAPVNKLSAKGTGE